MLISTIIPFHKNLSDLRKAIKSVENQILPDDFEIEIIVGNDSQISNKKIMEYLSDLNRFFVKIVKNKNASGAGNARNCAINFSKGEYLAFLDSDDIWHKKKLMSQIESIKKGYNFICTYYSYIGSKTLIKSPEKLFSSNYLFFSRPIGTSSVILEKRVLDSLRFSNEKFCQDLILWFRISKNEGFKYKCVKEKLTYYSLNGRTSRTNFFTRAKYFYRACKICGLKFPLNFLALLYYGIKGFINRIIKPKLNFI